MKSIQLSKRLLYITFVSASIIFMLPVFLNFAGTQAQDQASVFVKEVEFEGNTVMTSEALETLLRDYQNKSISMDDIDRAEEKIKKAYHDKGYFAAGVLFEEKDVAALTQDGVLKLRIIEGKIGQFIVQSKHNKTTVVEHSDSVEAEDSYADEAEEGYADEAEEGYADEAEEGYADEAEEGYADEAEEGYADEAEESYADEAEEGYADEAEESYADEAEESYADEAEEGYADEDGDSYADEDGDSDGDEAEDSNLSESSGARSEDQTSVLVKEVEFEGNTVMTSEVLEALLTDYINQDLSLDDIYEVKLKIEEAYQINGYIAARALFLEKDIPALKQDGVLRLFILEGDIGDFRVEGNTYYRDDVLARFFKPLLKHGIVNEALLQKGLLFTNDLPAVESTIVLETGDEPGLVDVVLATEDSPALKLAVDYNNFGPELTSENRYGLNFQITEPKWGATISLRGVTGDDFDDSALGIARLKIPVNSYGTEVSAAYLKGLYAAGQELASLGIEGDTDIYAFEVSHPFIKTDDLQLNAALGFDCKYSENDILGTKRSVDELNVFHVSMNFENLDRYLGKNMVSLGVYFGEVKVDPAIAPSRLNIDTGFERGFAYLSRFQKLPWFDYTNLLVRGSGQYSSQRLLPLEQMVIGGYGTVRGHEPANFLGDSGYTFSSELLFPPPYIADKSVFGQNLWEMVQLALFFDHGAVFNNDPEQGEQDSGTLNGVGGGIRLFYKDTFRASLEGGFPVDRDDAQDDFFAYVMVSFNYF